MERKYQVREVTPENLRCFGGLGCPAIYEGVRNVTPEKFDCLVGACHGVYEAKRNVYLIIGKQN